MQSEHQKRVRQLLQGINKPLPSKPEVGDRDQLLVQGRLLLEEVFEWLEAAGIAVTLDDGDPAALPYSALRLSVDITRDPDLVEMADASADISVVNTGAMCLNGISDLSILEEVDRHNLSKLGSWKLDPVSGKYVKPASFPEPDFGSVLRKQGWQPEGGSHGDDSHGS